MLFQDLSKQRTKAKTSWCHFILLAGCAAPLSLLNISSLGSTFTGEPANRWLIQQSFPSYIHSPMILPEMLVPSFQYMNLLFLPPGNKFAKVATEVAPLIKLLEFVGKLWNQVEKFRIIFLL